MPPITSASSPTAAQAGASGAAAAASSASHSGWPPAKRRDRTALFRELIAQHQPKSSADGMQGQKRAASRAPDVYGIEAAKSAKEREALLQRRNADREWMAEARRIHRAIQSLVSFLGAIRRVYLAQPGRAGAGARARGGGTGVDGDHGDEDDNDADGAGSAAASDPFAKWKRIRSMDDRERDELDFQVRVMLKRLMERIKELEKAEEVRKRTSPTSHSTANPLHYLLSLSSTTHSVHSAAYSSQLALHRGGIAHSLGAALARAGDRQRELQERRIEMRRTRIAWDKGLGGTAADGAAGAAAAGGATVGAGTSTACANGGALQGATKGIKLDPSLVISGDVSSGGGAGADGADVLSTLTPAQVQQFESENSALLRSFENDLASVQAAERKLHAISELQTQLLQHLGQQSEMTDRLLEESVGHSAEVRQGNKQLQKAKENSRQASRMLCVFLIGSGLGLLFLHWMD